jgi:hypothetical protein
MNSTERSRLHGIKDTFVSSRGFLICTALYSAYSLYFKLQHASARFQVPHNLIGSFAVYGRADRILDLFFYLFMTYMLVMFLRSANDAIGRILLASWIAPIVINPLKILLPMYCSTIWWLQLLMRIAFFVVSIAALIRAIQRAPSDQLPESAPK